MCISSDDMNYFAKPGLNNHARLSNLDGGWYGTGDHTGLVQSIKHDRDPTAIDDGSETTHAPVRVLLGALWLNTVTKDVFFCVDNTTGAAVWKQLGSGGGGSTIDLYNEGVYVGTVDALDFGGSLVDASISGTTGAIEAPPRGEITLTILEVTGIIPATTPFSVIASGANYTKTKDDGFLEVTGGAFGDNNNIIIKLNGLEQRKGVEVFWVDSQRFYLNINCYLGDEIEIYS